MKKEVLNLDVLNVNNLPELVDFEKNQNAIVAENPYIEIIDNKTYETAKQRRTALLKGRTALENQEKLIASKIATFRKSVGEKTKQLIDITLPHEEKQQSEVKRWEQIKEDERLENERIENQRIDNIKTMISDFESKCYEKIQSMTFETGLSVKNELDVLFNSEMDVQEFEILLDQAKMRVQNQFDAKSNDLTEKENQRKENERLRLEKEESDKKLREIEQQQQKDREEREAKEREQKEKVFEVRKQRLFGLGFEFGNVGFVFKEFNFFLSSEVIFNCDVIDFENIFNDSVKKIESERDQIAKEKQQREANEKAEQLAKQKAEKENKERQKRLATDKKIISESLETYFADLHLATENKEIQIFIEGANIKINALKNQLLTELNEL
jgi:colicin import membrane protein